jgi:hypothetical protein
MRKHKSNLPLAITAAGMTTHAWWPSDVISRATLMWYMMWLVPGIGQNITLFPGLASSIDLWKSNGNVRWLWSTPWDAAVVGAVRVVSAVVKMQGFSKDSSSSIGSDRWDFKVGVCLLQNIFELRLDSAMVAHQFRNLNGKKIKFELLSCCAFDCFVPSKRYYKTSRVEFRFSRHSPDWRVPQKFYSPNQRKLAKIMSLLSICTVCTLSVLGLLGK